MREGAGEGLVKVSEGGGEKLVKVSEGAREELVKVRGLGRSWRKCGRAGEELEKVW